MADAEDGVLHFAAVRADPDAVFVLNLEEDVVGRSGGGVQRRDGIGERLGDNLEGEVQLLESGAEVVGQGGGTCNLTFDTSVGINLAETCIDLEEHTDGRSPRGLTTVHIGERQLEVQVLAQTLVLFDTLQGTGRQTHHGDAWRAGQRFLRTGDHDVGFQLRHVEGIGQEGADAIDNEEQFVAFAEVADEVDVIVHTRRGLMFVDQEGGIALTLIGFEVLGFERLAGSQLDFGIGNLVQLEEFDKTMTETAAVHHDGFVLGSQAVHDGCLHAARTRTGHENDT